jgi:hypothetical protein
MTYRPTGAATSTSVSDNRINNTGVTILKATPVRFNTAGELEFINVGIEAETLSIAGVASADIPTATAGNVITSGKIANVSTIAIFGDVVWVAKSGGLTNLKPSIGIDGFVAGDFVVVVGVIAKNQDNPGNKDLVVNINLVGQL